MRERGDGDGDRDAVRSGVRAGMETSSSRETSSSETKEISGAMGSRQTGIGGRLLAFWDFLVLFSGISTASNLSRTRRDPIRRRGLFLFRSPRPLSAGRAGEDGPKG